MKVEVDLKKLSSTFGLLFFYGLVGIIGMEFYMSISKYNSIGNESYIAHHASIIQKEDPNLALEKRECLSKYWSVATKNRLGGTVDILVGGVSDVLNFLTFEFVEMSDSGKVLNKKYPFLVTDDETKYFAEKCGIKY